MTAMTPPFIFLTDAKEGGGKDWVHSPNVVFFVTKVAQGLLDGILFAVLLLYGDMFVAYFGGVCMYPMGWLGAGKSDDAKACRYRDRFGIFGGDGEGLKITEPNLDLRGNNVNDVGFWGGGVCIKEEVDREMQCTV
jgi:hypothetical protein